MRVSSVLLLVIVLVAGSASADPHTVGEALPPLELQDQHGEARALGPDARLVLFSEDMDGGGVLKNALKEGGAELIAGTGGVYIADLSGMPGLVRRMMVLPSLRRRPYSILVDQDGVATDRYPTVKGQATLIELDALTITGIEYFASADELRIALETRVAPESEPQPEGP